MDTKIPQMRAYPDPQIGVMQMMIPTRSLDLGQAEQTEVQISQMIPYPGKRGLKGQIALKGAEMIKEEYEAKKREVKTKVKSSYYNLFMVYKSMEIVSQHIELVKQLFEVAKTRYAVGKAEQQDILKSQVEIAKLYNKLIELNQKREKVEAMINMLLNRPIESTLGAPSELDVDAFKVELEELRQIALENRPELKRANLSIDKEKTAYLLAKKQYKPNFMVEYKRNIRHGMPDTWGAMVMINLPWIFKKKYDAGVKETEFMVESSKNMYSAMKNMTYSEIEDNYTAAQAAYEQANVYKTSIIPLAEQTLNASRVSYETGKVNFLTLIDNQRMLLNFQLAYFQEIVNFKKHLAELERVIGVDLDLYKK